MTKSGRITLLALASLPALSAIQAAPVSFRHDIAPILAGKCLACHKENRSRGGYRVDTFAALQQPGDSGETPLMPGKPEDGLFFHRLVTSDEDERMPAEDDPLPKEHIELFRRWIAEGAKFDGNDPAQPLAALLPKRSPASIPEKYPHPLPLTALLWMPDHQTLAVSGYHEVTLWDSASGKLKRRLRGLPERIFSLSLDPGSQQLAVAGGVPGSLGEVVIIDITSGSIVKSLPTSSDTQLAVAFSPDGKWLAYGGAANTLQLLSTKDWVPVWKAEAHADWIVQLNFSPDSQHLVSASRDRTARVFAVHNGEVVITQTTHGNPVNAAIFSADSKRLYTAASNGEVRVCDLAATVSGNGQIASTVITGRRQEATRLALAGQRLIIAAVDGRLRSFDITLKKDDKPLDHPNFGHRIEALALHPDGTQFAVAGQNGRVQILDLAQNKTIRTFTASPGW